MQDNGTHNNSQAHQNGDRTNDNVVSFPSSGDTQLRDISTLLQGAPVIQQEQSASKPGSEIATAEDFAQVEERRPFARKIGPKALLGMGLSLLVIFPIAGVFRDGGDGNSNSQQTAGVGKASSEEDGTYVSAEDYAAQQAEIEQLRSQQAFIDQQVDAEAIDAAGRQRQQQSRATAQQDSQLQERHQRRPDRLRLQRGDLVQSPLDQPLRHLEQRLLPPLAQHWLLRRRDLLRQWLSSPVLSQQPAPLSQ